MTDLIAPPRASSHSAPRPSPRWRLGEAMLLRVAGQPVEKVLALRYDRTASWARELLALEGDLDAATGRLRDTLTLEIAACPPESAERICLINLRRDVFNGRRPRPATLARALPVLGPEARAAVEGWVSALDECVVLARHGRDVLDAEVVTVRDSARRVLSDDALRAAVLLQSEVLERSMDRYLDPSRKVDKHARQVERTLLELLHRAALKTSPFSTLTSVGLVRVTDGPGPAHPRSAALRQHTRASLNIAVVARLAQAIGARPDLRSGLVVAASPGIRTEDDLVRYVRRRTTSSADAEAVVAIDTVHESLFFLPGGRVLHDVTDHLTRHPGSTVAELVRHVQGVVPGERRPADQVERLVGHLLRLGYLLLPELQVDLSAADPCRSFAERLSRQQEPVLRGIAEDLAAMLDLVDGYGATPPRQRAALLGGLRGHAQAAFARAEASPDLVPRTLLYEDAFLADRPAAVGRQAWDTDHLPALSALAGILPAFDLHLPKRLTTLGFFKARYGVGGRCEDLERFCHEYQRDFFDPYSKRMMRRSAFDDANVYQPQENWFGVDRIAAVDRARERAATHLDRLYRSLPADAEEISLGAEFVQDVQEALGPQDGHSSPWSFFVQLTDEGPDRPGTLVLNQAYAGMTTMFSRFVHGLEETDAGSTDVVRRVLRDSVPADTVLAELRGGYETSNLNVHPWLTDHELVCPGDVSERAAAAQIQLAELAVVHDQETDTLHLWSDRLQRRVVPVYLGFLMPMALPEIQQVLLCFSPAGMAPMDLWAGTGTPVAEDRVTAYPRITLHGLVLQRRMWKLARDLFPARRSGQHPADYFLEVQRWRRQHDLPRRLFAHIDFDAAPEAAVDGGAERDHPAGEGTQRSSTRKPLPVDLDSWGSVQLLEQLVLAARSRLTLKEALPDVDQLALTDDQGRHHVSELLIEIYPEEGR